MRQKPNTCNFRWERCLRYVWKVKSWQKCIEVQNFRYLGETGNTRHGMSNELKQRCRVRWAAYNSVQEMQRKAKPTNQAHPFNTVVLPSVLYGTETWALTKKEKMKFAFIQRAMEKRTLGSFHLDHVSSEELRQGKRTSSKGQVSMGWTCQQMDEQTGMVVSKKHQETGKMTRYALTSAFGSFWMRTAKDRKE